MEAPLIDKINQERAFAGMGGKQSGVGLLTKSESQMNIFSDVEFEIYALELWGFEDISHKKKATTAADQHFIDYNTY